jgi:hypothetical protein
VLLLLQLRALSELTWLFLTGTSAHLHLICLGLVCHTLLLLLLQIRALSELSWFFLTGTSAQLIAIGIAICQLLSDPGPEAYCAAAASAAAGAAAADTCTV